MLVSSYGDVVEIRMRQRHGKGILFVLKIREKENGNFCVLRGVGGYPNLGTVLLRYNGVGENGPAALLRCSTWNQNRAQKAKGD